MDRNEIERLDAETTKRAIREAKLEREARELEAYEAHELKYAEECYFGHE